VRGGGTYRRGLDGHYSGEINGGVIPATISRNGEREGEDCGRREMTCGAHMAVRGERAEGTGSGRGDAGPRLAFGVGPKGFPGSVFIFFSSLLLFLFCSS
jgi:hypothetical protein